VIGVLANRSARERLTGAEDESWRTLGTWCHDAAQEPVKLLETMIRQTVEIRDAEAGDFPADSASKASQLFAALAAELEQELPHACRRPA
jgi:hypothetical protein